jgi:hypothetical protein
LELNVVINGVILIFAYRVMPQLWRPLTGMKTALLYLTVLVNAAAFVYIYQWFIAEMVA